VECGFSFGLVSSNGDSAVKVTEDEEDDWHSLPPLGVGIEDCTTCGSAQKVCGIQSVNWVLDQDLPWPEEQQEVAGHRTTFMDVLKACVSDTESNVTAMCNKVENELYRLRAREKINERLFCLVKDVMEVDTYHTCQSIQVNAGIVP
jgi:hypothetical protein